MSGERSPARRRRRDREERSTRRGGMPRCRSCDVPLRRGMPGWAIAAAIVLGILSLPFLGLLGLPFLFVRQTRCPRCGR